MSARAPRVDGYRRSSGAPLAWDAHCIGLGDAEALRWLEAQGADLEAARVAAGEAGLLCVSVVLELLAGADHRELGRGMRRLAFELGSRWTLDATLMRAADFADQLTTERRPQSRGALAFEAGAELRSALRTVVGSLMTRAQTPDLIERIRLLGSIPDGAYQAEAIPE